MFFSTWFDLPCFLIGPWGHVCRCLVPNMGVGQNRATWLDHKIMNRMHDHVWRFSPTGGWVPGNSESYEPHPVTSPGHRRAALLLGTCPPSEAASRSARCDYKRWRRCAPRPPGEWSQGWMDGTRQQAQSQLLVHYILFMYNCIWCYMAWLIVIGTSAPLLLSFWKCNCGVFWCFFTSVKEDHPVQMVNQRALMDLHSVRMG